MQVAARTASSPEAADVKEDALDEILIGGRGGFRRADRLVVQS
jgi:hypothetical protein